MTIIDFSGATVPIAISLMLGLCLGAAGIVACLERGQRGDRQAAGAGIAGGATSALRLRSAVTPASRPADATPTRVIVDAA